MACDINDLQNEFVIMCKTLTALNKGGVTTKTTIKWRHLLPDNLFATVWLVFCKRKYRTYKVKEPTLVK